jgi:hypothetical protein
MITWRRLTLYPPMLSAEGLDADIVRFCRYHSQGSYRTVSQLVGHAAQEDLRHGAVQTTPNHDEAGVLVVCETQDLGSRAPCPTSRASAGVELCGSRPRQGLPMYLDR